MTRFKPQFSPGLAVALLMLAATPFARGDYELTVLHINDLHARFEPISRFDSSCSEEDNAEGKCFGGMARLVSAVNEARARNPNPILLSGGDQFQGTLFYNFHMGKVAAEFMDKLAFDGMAVGNHEFDNGPEVLRTFVEAVNFPVVLANADYTNEALISDVITASAVVEKGGEKIGLIGISPVDTDELSSPGRNISFSDPVAPVQKQVDRLTAQGINKIILLSHSGYTVDKRVAAQTTGVDVIVGGHDNSLLSNLDEDADGPYPTMVGSTAIVQAYAYGKYLGVLNVVFDDAGNVKSAAGEPRLLDVSVSEDQATKERVSELAAPLERIRNKVIAASAVPIDQTQCRLTECEMGNLVAEAMLEMVRDNGYTIAIGNGGGLRASIDAGDITMGELMTVLPFQNTLSTFQVDGATIIAALENGVSQVEEKKGRFPQVAGLRYTWDQSVAPNEGRIKTVEVRDGGQWVPIDHDRVYGVVSNNYVRNGGDGYKMFIDAENAYDYGPDIVDVVIGYLDSRRPYTPQLDGRISQR